MSGDGAHTVEGPLALIRPLLQRHGAVRPGALHVHAHVSVLVQDPADAHSTARIVTRCPYGWPLSSQPKVMTESKALS